MKNTVTISSDLPKLDLFLRSKLVLFADSGQTPLNF